MNRITLLEVALPVLVPEDREMLQPFVLIFDRVLIPKVRTAGFRKAGGRTLGRVAAELDFVLQVELGHRLEPVITMFALRRCCQAYVAAIDQNASIRLQRAQIHLMDCSWRLIVELEQSQKVDELLTLIRSL